MTIRFISEENTLYCGERWDLSEIPQLKHDLYQVLWPKDKKIIINGRELQKMDSAGAWLLISLRERLISDGCEVALEGFASPPT